MTTSNRKNNYKTIKPELPSLGRIKMGSRIPFKKFKLNATESHILEHNKIISKCA